MLSPRIRHRFFDIALNEANFDNTCMCFVIYDIDYYIYIIGLYFSATMPSFKETTCQGQTQADMCIAVSFTNGAHDTLVLNKASEASSIYEGFLQGARDVPVVVIDIPIHNKRFVSNFHQRNSPSRFDETYTL